MTLATTVSRIVEVGDALDAGRSATRSESPSPSAADVDVDVLRDLERLRLERDHVERVREDAALLDAGRLAGQLDRDLRLDRLVEADLEQVDVRDGVANAVALVVLEDRRARLRLALELDVEDRVEAVGAGQRAAELPLLDRERARLVVRGRR